MKKNILACIIFILANLPGRSQSVVLVPYVSNIVAPIDIQNCGDDRLFVAERIGRVRVINPDGTLRTQPFLDIREKISSTNVEEGFLGVAFSPDYKTSGKFYVSYTDSVGPNLISVIEQYSVSTNDSNVADPNPALRIITVQQPFQNHNGGNIIFGPDHYLYIFWGDGGSSGDPFNNAQNRSVLLGKILRIVVLNASVTSPYSIPSSNPFVDS